MGVFFRSEPLHPVVKEKLSMAFSQDPSAITSVEKVVEEETKKVVERTRGEFSWGRMIFAVGLLALVFIGAVYTGRDPGLKDLYTVLVHGFEIILGGVSGLLLGEAVAKG